MKTFRCEFIFFLRTCIQEKKYHKKKKKKSLQNLQTKHFSFEAWNWKFLQVAIVSKIIIRGDISCWNHYFYTTFVALFVDIFLPYFWKKSDVSHQFLEGPYKKLNLLISIYMRNLTNRWFSQVKQVIRKYLVIASFLFCLFLCSSVF